MSAVTNRVEHPELFFGIVAPIGTDIDPTLQALAAKLSLFGYEPIVIHVTDVFKGMHAKLPLGVDLKDVPLEKRYETYIAYGNALRKHFDEPAFLALTAINQVLEMRRVTNAARTITEPQKTA